MIYFMNFNKTYTAHLCQIANLGPEMGSIAIYDKNADKYLDPFGDYATQALWHQPEIWLRHRSINLDLCEVVLHWR